MSREASTRIIFVINPRVVGVLKVWSDIIYIMKVHNFFKNLLLYFYAYSR